MIVITLALVNNTRRNTAWLHQTATIVRALTTRGAFFGHWINTLKTKSLLRYLHTLFYSLKRKTGPFTRSTTNLRYRTPFFASRRFSLPFSPAPSFARRYRGVEDSAFLISQASIETPSPTPSQVSFPSQPIQIPISDICAPTNRSAISATGSSLRAHVFLHGLQNQSSAPRPHFCARSDYSLFPPLPRRRPSITEPRASYRRSSNTTADRLPPPTHPAYAYPPLARLHAGKLKNSNAPKGVCFGRGCMCVCLYSRLELFALPRPLRIEPGPAHRLAAVHIGSGRQE